MITFTLTYYKDKPSHLYEYHLAKHGADIIDSGFNLETFKKFCGSLAHLSLRFIPDYELKDTGSYSVDAICYHMKGILKIEMHNLLCDLGTLCTSKELDLKTLKRLLDEPMLYDCLDLLKVTPKDIFKVLLYSYLCVSGMKDKALTFESMLNTQATFSNYYNFYLGEVCNVKFD